MTVSLLCLSVATIVASGSGLLGIRFVDLVSATAAADAVDHHHNPNGQNQRGIVLVDSFVSHMDKACVICAIIVNGSERDGCELASRVEAENARGDDCCEEDAVEAAEAEKTAGAGSVDHGASAQAKFPKGHHYEEHAAETEDDGEARAFLSLVLAPRPVVLQEIIFLRLSGV